MSAGPPVLPEPELLALKRDLGDGYARFARRCSRGEGILHPGGGLGIGGEAFPDLNWGDTWGPRWDEAFRLFVARLRERGLPGVLSTMAGVGDEAAGLARELGIGEAAAVVPFMVCPRERARADRAGLVCRRLEPGDAEAADVIWTEAFEPPPGVMAAMMGPAFFSARDVSFWAAEVDGRAAAVACGIRIGDTGGIYAVGTLPELRRRGAGGAAVSAAMEHLAGIGVTTFALQASDIGRPVYERLGFRTEAQVTLWAIPEA